MEIEVKKSEKFHTEIIDVWNGRPEAITDFQRVSAKRASELMADAIDSAIKTKKYFGDVIEVTVSVSIGDPTEEASAEHLAGGDKMMEDEV